MTLSVQVYGQLGQSSFADCPDFEFSKGEHGDATFSLTFPFSSGRALPFADSMLVIEDDSGPNVWSGFTGVLDPPELCKAGSCTINALGWAAQMGLRHREAETIYGPRWTQAVIAGTIEGAIVNAVTQGAQDVMVLPQNMDTSGITLPTTESFQGQTPAEIVDNMAARTQYLATPYLWSVRQRFFYWRSMDTAPRYRVLMANKARVKPHYDPSKVYNRVIVGWGKNQTATWPGPTSPPADNNESSESVGAISYAHRGQIVDLYLNAGVEVGDWFTALRLARGIYARMQLLSPEWSFDVTIPQGCPVEQLVDGAWVQIPAYQVEPTYFLEVPDIDQGAYGPQLSVPTSGFMTRVGWKNKTGELSVSLGEPRGPGNITKLARRVVAHGVSPLNIWGYLGRDVSSASRSSGKTPLLGPNLPNAVASDQPPPIDYQTPGVSTKQNTLLPEVLPPLPPAVPYQINDADSMGIKGAFRYPPQKFITYSLIASRECTVVITVLRMSNGALIGQFSTAGAVLTPTGLYAKLDKPMVPPITLEKDDHLTFEITTEDAVMGEGEWISITLAGVRSFPGYPGDRAPITGGRP